MLGRRRVGAGERHCPLLLCASGKVANKAIVFAQWLCFGFVFFPCLTARGQGACFIVWVLSSLCVANSTHLQRDIQGIVCLLKKKEEEDSFVSCLALCS